MPDCHHEDFDANVAVMRLSDHEGGPVTHFAAEVSIVCRNCRAPLGFRGMQVGLLPGEPTTSPDALIARMPLISPAELELLGPLAALRQHAPPITGFTMRERSDGA